MVWKFNNIVIENVIDAEFDRDAGKITLQCEAEGDMEVTTLHHATSTWSQTATSNSDRNVLGTYAVDLGENDKIFIQPGITNTGVNNLKVYDKLNIIPNDDNPTVVSFGSNNNITPTTRIEITDLLNTGSNTVELQVEGTEGPTIGSSDIYIVKRGGKDPRDTIKIWQEYESNKTSNIWTIEGKRVLQATNTIAYKLQDFHNTWTAVLDNVTFTEDSFSNQSIIYKLVFLVGNEVFLDEYGQCFEGGSVVSGIVSNPYLDNSTTTTDHLPDTLGEITLQSNTTIQTIAIYGGGIDLPSWIEVNGVRKYWHYKYDENIEKMIFGGINNTKATITSPNYLSNPTSYFGSKINAICLERATDSMGILANKTYNAPFTSYSNVEIYNYTNATNQVTPAQSTSQEKFGSVATNVAGSGTHFGWQWITGALHDDNDSTISANTSSGVGGTDGLQISNFGFAIPSNATVNSVAARVRYFNNSHYRPPYYNIVKHYMKFTGPGLYSLGEQPFTSGSETATSASALLDAWFDSNYNMSGISSNPATYNDPSFAVKYSATLDARHSCIVQYIYALVRYTVPGSTTTTYTQGAMGYMNITESKEVNRVVIYGSGDTPPVSVSVNGQWQNVDKFKSVAPIGKVELVYDIPPSKTIAIRTTESSANSSHGFWLDRAVVFYV